MLRGDAEVRSHRLLLRAGTFQGLGIVARRSPLSWSLTGHDPFSFEPPDGLQAWARARLRSPGRAPPQRRPMTSRGRAGLEPARHQVVPGASACLAGGGASMTAVVAGHACVPARPRSTSGGRSGRARAAPCAAGRLPGASAEQVADAVPGEHEVDDKFQAVRAVPDPRRPPGQRAEPRGKLVVA